MLIYPRISLSTLLLDHEKARRARLLANKRNTRRLGKVMEQPLLPGEAVGPVG